MLNAGKIHLVEAFRWSVASRTETAEIIAAGLGMAVPVLLGMVSGHLAAGLAATLGGMVVSGVGIRSSAVVQAESELAAVVPAVLASCLAVVIYGHTWLTALMLVLLPGVAAIIGGYSRFTVKVTKRFIVFLTIISALISPTGSLQGSRPLGLLLLVTLGALWTSVLNQLFGALTRRRRNFILAIPDGSASIGTPSQKLRRWNYSLTRFTGWQYPLRLVLGLGVAVWLRCLWPDHHLHWVALTVAILTPRTVEAVPVKTTQRSLGTAIGVLAASLFMAFEVVPWVFVATIGLLAGARPLLKAKNYLAYSVIMTPLIILIMDAGQPPDRNLLIERLVSTLLGAALVIGANLLFVKLSPRGRVRS
jgi:hypothetical protein